LYGQHEANNAVNGKIDDFTHTLREVAEKWWMVDLEKKFHVSSIKIWNRQDNNCNQCMYKYI